MATNDTPNLIDEIFADGRLIDDAMRSAAEEAIERQQRAGEPVVVFRNGRIAHVSAGDLARDVEVLLTDEQFAQERTAKGLIAWVEECLSAIIRCSPAKESALFHQGSFKRFSEEARPLAFWLRHLYADREDVTCCLNSGASGDWGYDAVVRNRAANPATETYVELTTASFDRTELRRMKILVEDGFVPALGPPSVLLCFSPEEKLQLIFEKIERVARGKSDVSYGANYVLVVSFDDSHWDTDDDLAGPLRSFVSERLGPWRLDVATLYLVGMSGRTFESFPVPRR